MPRDERDPQGSDVPPEMQFDREDGLFEDGPDDRRRRRPSRYVYAWEKAAEESRAPAHHHTCCGTTFGAVTPDLLRLLVQCHVASASHKTGRDV